MSIEVWIAAGAAAIVVASLARHGVPVVDALRARLRDRIIVVGMTPLVERIVADGTNGSAPRCRIVGVVDDPVCAGPRAGAPPIVGRLDGLAEIVDRFRPNRVVVALSEWRRQSMVSALVESCVVRGIAVEGAAECYERVTGRLALEAMTPASIILSGQFRLRTAHCLIARLLSAVAALAGLICTLPLLLVVAIAIKLDSPGPVLFVQPRVGRSGRPFNLIKFRTMTAMSTLQRTEWAADNQSRITRVGKWLRTLRLDELPQFINILRGDMNLVGPRPHPVRNHELLTLVARNLNETTGACISYYHLRTMVRPGLTGWAQVRYRYANDLDEEIEKLTYDLYYVKHASLGLDLRILLETFRVLVAGRLADGAATRPPERVAPALRAFPLPPAARSDGVVVRLSETAAVARDVSYAHGRRS